ncbi:MAG: SDR family NAD(P)-dependent oxidoreductase [Polyangiaceae bacterium]|jgi:NADP-dependent 3-hydroxy acid dehydrogenase YdfG
MSKTGLGTEASSGIGAASVEALLARGPSVYAGARRVNRVKAPAEAGARVLALDVTDDTSIGAVEAILRECGRIDVLVNNAGYGTYGALEDVPLAEGKKQVDVNIFGLARLIQLVLPTMRAQRYATGGGARLLPLLRRLLTDRAFDALMRMFVRQEMSS